MGPPPTSMSDAALLAAIRAAPADDAPRLVYADWLDEHGQPERAEFIRLQCELARRGDPALRRREAELLAAHHDAFAGPLAAPHLRFRFARGFIVAFGHAGVFLRDQPGARSHALSLYRFLWDGTWMSAVGASPEGFADMVRQRPDLIRLDTDVHAYFLDSLVHPALIRVHWHSADEWSDSTGTFDGTTLILDAHRRSDFDHPGQVIEKRTRKRFVHYPVPGFDSFPET